MDAYFTETSVILRSGYWVLPWAVSGYVKIDRFVVGPVIAEETKRQFFTLGQLAHGIQEIYLHDDAGHRLVSRVCDGTVDVTDRGSDEIFGGGHFEIGEPELRDIRRGRHDFFRRVGPARKGGAG